MPLVTSAFVLSIIWALSSSSSADTQVQEASAKGRVWPRAEDAKAKDAKPAESEGGLGEGAERLRAPVAESAHAKTYPGPTRHACRILQSALALVTLRLRRPVVCRLSTVDCRLQATTPHTAPRSTTTILRPQPGAAPALGCLPCFPTLPTRSTGRPMSLATTWNFSSSCPRAGSRRPACCLLFSGAYFSFLM